jgi:signal transduction histidine kinase
MRMKKALVAGFLWLLSFGMANAQLRLYVDGQPVPASDSRILYRFAPSRDMMTVDPSSPGGADWIMADDTLTQKSIHDQSLWIRIPLSIFRTPKPIVLISVENPHINFLKCWFMIGDSVIHESPLMGDHLPFDRREIPDAGFSFSLPQGHDPDLLQLVLALEKRRSKMEVPLYVSTINDIAIRKESEGVEMGFLLGFIALLALIQLYLLISTGDKAHAWYTLYLLIITGYLLADQGLLFKYLFPGTPAYNDLVRPAFLTLCLQPVMMFYRTLLRLKHTMPRHDHILRWVLGVHFLLMLIGFSSRPTEDYAAQRFWIVLISLVSPAILILFLWITVTAKRKKIPLAGYATFSLSGLSLFILLFSLNQNDRLPDGLAIISHGQYAGMMLDGIVMTFALIHRFLSFQRRNRELRQQIREQQELIFREVAQWQHREMNRISHFLHDSLGSSLALIRLETDYMELTEENRRALSEKIHGLGADIRQMSHNFSTRLLEEKGVRTILEEQIHRIRQIHDIDIQLEWIGNDNSIRFHYQMMVYLIVQELLRNLIRHARATRANLQILTAENRVYIYMEDDGVGATDTESGIGLKHIRELVELLRGSFNIHTATGQGFSISIEFNQTDHEDHAHRDS